MKRPDKFLVVSSVGSGLWRVSGFMDLANASQYADKLIATSQPDEVVMYDEDGKQVFWGTKH